MYGPNGDNSIVTFRAPMHNQQEIVIVPQTTQPFFNHNPTILSNQTLSMNTYVHSPHQPQFVFTHPKPIPLKPVPTAVIPKLILTPTQVPPLPAPYMVVSQSQDKFAQTDMILKPNQIGLIPHDFWSHYKKISFENMIHTYFHRRNSSHARFVYKLYNALLITAAYPSLLPMIGVSWETNNIIKVRKTPFASLIGTRIADNSLFHKQGNFPTHGFAELTSEEAVVHNINISYIDFDEIRLVYHLNGKFTKNCGEKVLKSCIWKRNGQDL